MGYETFSGLPSGQLDKHGEVPACLCCAHPGSPRAELPAFSRATAAFIFHQGEGKGLIALISVALVSQ